MKIAFDTQVEKKSFNSKNPAVYPRARVNQHDSVTFGAIKKSALQEFSLAVANMFKAPLEKFNSEGDLHKWAGEKFKEIIDLSQYKTTFKLESDERLERLSQWKKFLTEDNTFIKNNKLISQIIFSSITKGLKNNNRTLPPLLDSKTLGDTLAEIKKHLKQDRNYKFNFTKQYNLNLRTNRLNQSSNKDVNKNIYSGWVKIPSHKNDAKNFERNIETLKMLSHDSWCTKSLKTKSYLEQGDLHIFLDKAKPKIGIRFEGDEIIEIQGEKNNRKIPLGYIDEVQDYLNKNKFKKVNSQVEDAKEAKIRLNKAIIELKDAIKNKDYVSVLKHFGIEAEKADDGLLVLLEYRQPDKFLDFKDLGIKENDLFKQIKEIKGNASFRFSDAEDLGRLEKIGENAYFKNSKMKSLGQLQSIGKNAYFRKSKIADTGQLDSIGKDAYVDFDSKLNLSKVKINGVINN